MSSRRLLHGGLVAGPLFLSVWLVQALTRDGFDPSRHPISLLSTGELGWIQILNFVTSGALVVGAAIGLRRALGGGQAALWGPRLVAAFGVGLIGAGVFVTDPGAGFPAGAPLGAPERFTWHAILHEISFGIAQLSWLALCIVMSRRFTGLQQSGNAFLCVGAAVAVFVIAAWPNLETLSPRLVVATALEFGFVAGVAAYALRSAFLQPLSPNRPTEVGSATLSVQP